MSLSKLPIEVHWMIGEQLDSLQDLVSLSLVNKQLHTNLNQQCYAIALFDRTNILAWAAQPGPWCEGRADAAKKYLQMGGGGDAYHGTTKQGKGPYSPSTGRTWFERQRYQYRIKFPGNKRPEIPGRVINPEITHILTWLATPNERCNWRSKEDRLKWLCLVLENAALVHLAKITSVHWQLLLYRTLMDFGKSSKVGGDVLELIKRAVAVDSPHSIVTKPTDSLSAVLKREDLLLQHINLVERRDLQQTLGSDFMMYLHSYTRKFSLTPETIEMWTSPIQALLRTHQRFSQDNPALADSTNEIFINMMMYLASNMMKAKSRKKESERKFLGRTILPLVCQEGHVHAAKHLLDTIGVKPNVRDNQQRTPIMNAGTHTMFEFLRARGADLRVRSTGRHGSLLTAAISQRTTQHGTLDVDDLELEKSFLDRIRLIARVYPTRDILNNGYGEIPPLFLAMGARGLTWMSGVRLLLELGADVNARCYCSPISSLVLQMAIIKRLPQDFVSMLINHGANPHRRNTIGYTAFELPNAKDYNLTKQRRDGRSMKERLSIQ